MADIVTISTLNTLLPTAIINKITGSDNTIAQAAIDAAILEAKSYLSRFDISKLFNTAANGYVADVNLQQKIKYMAQWNLIQRVNVNVDMQLAKENYDDAIQWLKDVHKGQADPAGWPLLADDTDTEWPEDKVVHYTSNDKRTQHF